jgi:1,4-alpha-glucan branching enzyme
VDDSWDGFSWIDPNNTEQSIVSYRRIDAKGNELVILINFTPVAREGFRLGVPEGEYKELINSDDERFGGSGVINTGVLVTEEIGAHNSDSSLCLRVPPLGMTVLKRVAPKKTARKKRPTKKTTV